MMITIDNSSKLEGASNYGIWKFKIKTMLIREDLWDLVNPAVDQALGVAEVVDADATSGEVATQTAPRVSRARAQDATTTKRKYKALAIIVSSIRDELIPYVVDLDDSQTCWKTLQYLYETHNAARSLYFNNKLLSVRIEEGTPILDFLRKIKKSAHNWLAIAKLWKKHGPSSQTLMNLSFKLLWELMKCLPLTNFLENYF